MICSSQIKIAFSTDNNYVKPMVVCMLSILKNASSNNNYHFIIFDNGIKNQQAILKAFKNYSNASIEFLDIRDKKEVLEDYGRFSQASFDRIYLPEILQDDDKILYLDCDTLVMDDLTALYQTDINDVYAAVCIDPAIEDFVENERTDILENKEKFKSLNWKSYVRDILKLEDYRTYFFSGMLLMNLKKMRQDHICQKVINFIKEVTPVFPDQDAYNSILQGQIKILPNKWGISAWHAYFDATNQKLKDYYKPFVANPGIIHIKGWVKERKHAYLDLYQTYLKESGMPMKKRLYIITYRRDDVLNKNLKTLWATTKHPEELEVTVVSNYPTVQIDPENRRNNLRIVINETRTPNSWGYLSRDWNFGIVDCFKNWRNPDNVDWCILAQNDVEWLEGWDEWLDNCTDFDFISQPRGDQAMAINIEGVKKLGFFDERFTTLNCQEHDYFTRAVLILKERCSINDDHTPTTNYNPVGCVLIKGGYTGVGDENDTLHNGKFSSESMCLRSAKWKMSRLTLLDRENLNKLDPIPQIPKEINWYPFFWEGYKDIENQFINEYFNEDWINFGKLKQKKGNRKKFLKFISKILPVKSWRKKVRGHYK